MCVSRARRMIKTISVTSSTNKHSALRPCLLHFACLNRADMSLVVHNRTTKKLQSERHVAEPRYKSGGCASLSGLELQVIVQWAEQQPFGRRDMRKSASSMVTEPCFVLHAEVGMIAQLGLPAYRIRHFLRLLLLSFLEVRAARVACSKTSRTPSLVLAEHSMYSLAPILSLTCLACSSVTGVCEVL